MAVHETRYLTAQAQAEDGRSLNLSYILLKERKADGKDHYGVKVIEEASSDHAEALDLTTDAKRIYELIDKLGRNTVTPSGLMDIVADWL